MKFLRVVLSPGFGPDVQNKHGHRKRRSLLSDVVKILVREQEVSCWYFNDAYLCESSLEGKSIESLLRSQDSLVWDRRDIGEFVAKREFLEIFGDYLEGEWLLIAGLKKFVPIEDFHAEREWESGNMLMYLNLVDGVYFDFLSRSESLREAVAKNYPDCEQVDHDFRG